MAQMPCTAAVITLLVDRRKSLLWTAESPVATLRARVFPPTVHAPEAPRATAGHAIPPRSRFRLVVVTTVWLSTLLATLSTVLTAPPSVAAPVCNHKTATIIGSRARNVLRGTPKPDVIFAGAGSDVVWGRGGNDIVCGGYGADLIYGGGGADHLLGGYQNDLVIGGMGPDVLIGGYGYDVCGPGNDKRFCNVTDSQPGRPLTAAFYYPWYPQGWGNRAKGYTRFHPSLGWYDGGKVSIVGKQIAAMRYAHIQAGIASWWGDGSVTDKHMPALLKAAAPTHFRWTIYYEREGHGDPSRSRIEHDLALLGARYGTNRSYLRIGGRFVVFVWADAGDRCDMAKRWRGMQRLGVYVVLKLFPGFENCRYQPDWWHQYAPAGAVQDMRPWSFTISPGFWHGGSSTPTLRRDLDRWRYDVQRMNRVHARLHLVTTFNEWGEGTAVESAAEWKSASHRGRYLDVLHKGG
jgi:RTX calcium-binding nonapeptide repeat (4 copies)